jgi:hypothetical protein
MELRMMIGLGLIALAVTLLFYELRWRVAQRFSSTSPRGHPAPMQPTTPTSARTWTQYPAGYEEDGYETVVAQRNRQLDTMAVREGELVALLGLVAGDLCFAANEIRRLGNEKIADMLDVQVAAADEATKAAKARWRALARAN